MPDTEAGAPETRAAGAPAAEFRSATNLFCASARNTPFGNCSRYASKSAGFVLFTIDCQNRPSNSAPDAAGAAGAFTDGVEVTAAEAAAPDAPAS